MNYKVPLKDIHFVSKELLNNPDHYKKFKAGQGVSPELFNSILNDAAQFCELDLASINRSGDAEGCTLKNGDVTTPKGFKEAYQKYIDDGWSALSEPTEFGGQGLPKSIQYMFGEMMISANNAWALTPGLRSGVSMTINAHASDSVRACYLPKLVSGEWTGSMALTESEAGSDLGLLKASAVPLSSSAEKQAYKITGEKIYISSGETDLSKNIIHLVLARLPDAPAGIKGLSLFIVPKFMVNADGILGKRNAVLCTALEDKMGINGSPSCTLKFNGAEGYLLGEPNKGLNAMFTCINESRLSVSIQGPAHTEVSFQKALAFAKGREQFRMPNRINPDRPADSIIHHADVRRMLLTQKAIAEGGRMVNMFCGQQIDITLFPDFSVKEKARANALVSILTPISKGFFSEISLETTSHGIQILGGRGFSKDWELEQELRDNRMCQIVEGTTCLQGLDLLGRKILGSRGKAIQPLFTLFDELISDNENSIHAERFKTYYLSFKKLIQSVGEQAQKGGEPEVNGAAVEFLMCAGFVTCAYFWSRAAIVAENKLKKDGVDKHFYQSKIETADFYYQRIMPRMNGLVEIVNNGAESMVPLNAESFDLFIK